MIIEGKKKYNVPSVEYRKIKALNQSMIAKFDSEPLTFYKEFILGERVEKKSSYSLSVGTLVDFYLLECDGNAELFEQKFSEKYILHDGIKGTGQVFILADNLFDITIRDMSEDGSCPSSFMDRIKEAFEKTQSQGKYNGKTLEKAIVDFNENGNDYYNLRIQSISKEIVELATVENARAVATQLLSDDFTSHLFRNNGNDELETINKLAIEWKWKDESTGIIVDCKSEIDKLRIDHTNKRIHIYDLKCSYDNEGHEYSYIKWYYYLQNGFYYNAVKYWAMENGLEDYTILPITFIVADTSSNKRRPLQYKTTMKHIEQAENGFWFNGSYYRGLKELIGEIVWASENGIWTVSKQNYLKKGVLTLKDYA